MSATNKSQNQGRACSMLFSHAARIPAIQPRPAVPTTWRLHTQKGCDNAIFISRPLYLILTVITKNVLSVNLISWSDSLYTTDHLWTRSNWINQPLYELYDNLDLENRPLSSILSTKSYTKPLKQHITSIDPIRSLRTQIHSQQWNATSSLPS